MNCQNHPDTPATAYCRTCGKPVCDACRRDAFSTVFCAEHAPAPAQASTAPPPASAFAPPAAEYYPPPAGEYYPPPGAGVPPPSGSVFPASRVQSNISPALAFFLGTIPGVGAIYNGQYAKGLVHAIVWGLLMSIANSQAARGLEPIFVMLVIAWWAYMAIEAHRTAHKLQAGEPVDEYSSLIHLHGRGSQAPVAGVALVALGILLLLHTLNLLDFEYIARYWPVLLIAAGVYILWSRLSGTHREIHHER